MVLDNKKSFELTALMCMESVRNCVNAKTSAAKQLNANKVMMSQPGVRMTCREHSKGLSL